MFPPGRSYSNHLLSMSSMFPPVESLQAKCQIQNLCIYNTDTLFEELPIFYKGVVWILHFILTNKRQIKLCESIS